MIRGLTFFWLAVMTICHAVAQEEQKIDKRTARQLAREYGDMQLIQGTEMNAILLDSLIAVRSFMIRADYVSNPAGERTLVDERTNFIAIDSSVVRVQYSLEYLIGGGGLDGFSVTGSIARFSVDRVGIDHGMYSISVTALADARDFSLFAIVAQNGEATVTIDGFTTGKLTYYGTVSFLDEDVINGNP